MAALSKDALYIRIIHIVGTRILLLKCMCAQIGYCPTAVAAVNARGRGQCFSHIYIILQSRTRGRSTRIKDVYIIKVACCDRIFV